MDANLSPTRNRLYMSLSLLALASAGCSSKPSVPTVHPGLAVFEKAIELPANPHTIVREGNQVTYMVTSLDDQQLYARFDASCTQAGASMYFPTNQGMQAFAERSARNNNLPEPQLRQLQQSQQLKKVCTQRPLPDWRAIEPVGDQDWLMLDLNSIEDNNAVRSVWAGLDPLHYSFSKRDASLVGQRRERLLMDCEKQTLMMPSRFIYGTNNKILSGQLNTEASLQPLSEATSEQRRVFKAACQPQSQMAKLQKVWERQPLPPMLQTPVAAPKVVDAIRALSLPTPDRTLRHIRYHYDVRMFNGMSAGNLLQDTFISTDRASGQVLLQTMDPVVDPASVRLTFLGFFDLATRSINKETGEEEDGGRPLVDLSFTGDWQAMPSNSEISYTRTFGKKPSGPGTAKNDSNTVTCQIGQAQSAKRIFPTLEGTAKPIHCTRLKSKQANWTEDYWYLADYRLFVKGTDNSLMGLWKWQIESVK